MGLLGEWFFARVLNCVPTAQGPVNVGRDSGFSCPAHPGGISVCVCVCERERKRERERETETETEGFTYIVKAELPVFVTVDSAAGTQDQR